MAQKKEKRTYADFVIARVQPSKKNPVVVFHRNNLSLNDFRRTEEGFLYEDCFSYKGIHGTIKVKVKGESLAKSLFRLKKKDLNVRGTYEHFGLTMQFANQKKPCIKKEFSRENVDISFECNGETWPISPYQLRGIKSSFHNGKAGKVQSNIATSDSWSIQHPYSGGSVTPR